jgi:hypothetical protein
VQKASRLSWYGLDGDTNGKHGVNREKCLSNALAHSLDPNVHSLDASLQFFLLLARKLTIHMDLPTFLLAG